MCSAVNHTISFEGDHGSASYIYSIWAKNTLQNAANRGSADGIEPIFEQVVKKGFEPAVILFPCPEKMYANISTFGSRDLEFCASYSYQLTREQESVNLVFAKTSHGFELSQNIGAQVAYGDEPLAGPFR